MEKGEADNTGFRNTRRKTTKKKKKSMPFQGRQRYVQSASLLMWRNMMPSLIVKELISPLLHTLPILLQMLPSDSVVDSDNRPNTDM